MADRDDKVVTDAPADPKLARVLAQLEEALGRGDFYAALQMYRTVASRKFDAGAVADARALVVQGARALAAKGKVHEAADLGDLMIKTLDTRGKPVCADDVAACEAVADCLEVSGVAAPAGASSGRASASSGGAGAAASAEARARLARVTFLQSALRWAKHSPRLAQPEVAIDAAGLAAAAAAAKSKPTPKAVPPLGDEDEEDGIHGGDDGGDEETEGELPPTSRRALIGRLQLRAARACVAGGPEFFPDAQRHYLGAPGCGTELGRFLYDWALRGYARERDLYLARAVLQLLATSGNMRDANAARDEFLRRAAAGDKDAAAAVFDSPLAHFVKFLLLTLERDARPLFLTLCDKYRPALSTREPELAQLLPAIGKRFFGIEPPVNPMQQMMQSMLGLGGNGGGAGGGAPRLPGFPSPK